MRYLTTVIGLLCFFAACDKGAADALTNTPLTGKWKLTDYLISPGPIGEWQKADPSSPSYITFKNNGTLEIIPRAEYTEGQRYWLLSDSLVLIIRTTDSLQYRYEVDKDRLTLYPPCIEPCANKYVRVSRTN